MVNIGSIRIVNKLSLEAFETVSGLIDAMKSNPLIMTKKRFMNGVDHNIVVGNDQYTIKVVFSNHDIKRVVVKCSEVQS